MTFQFCDSMFHDYRQQGYVVFRNIVPPSLLTDLRREADKARELAREIHGAQTQRIQPIARYEAEIDQKPFQDYCELPDLQDAIDRLLGPGYSYGQRSIMGLLIEPRDRPWNVGWHRDGVVELPLEAYDEEARACLARVWNDLRYFNQVNCAIYADSCTWYVPGSHLRQQDLPGERQSTGDAELARVAETLSVTEAERFWLDHCRQMPGAVQVHLAVGDFMIYRTLAWHTGNYITYQPRATIHDAVIYQDGIGCPTGWPQAKRDAIERLAARNANIS
jgi:hypothetical protein